MKTAVARVGLFLLRCIMLLGILYMLYRVGAYTYDFGYQIYSEKGVDASPGVDMAVVIREDQSVEEIGNLLERLGLIRNAKVFMIQERLSKYHGEIMPGNYILNTSQSGNMMIDILTGHSSEEESEEI